MAAKVGVLSTQGQSRLTEAALFEQCLRAKLVYGEPWHTSGPFPPGLVPAPELPQKPTQLPDIAVKVGLAALDTPKTYSEGEPEDEEIFYSSELSVATSPSERSSSRLSGTWQDPHAEMPPAARRLEPVLRDFSPVQSPINSKPNPGLLSTSPPWTSPALATSCAAVPNAVTACATSPPYPSRPAQVCCEDAGLLAQLAQGPFAPRSQLATPAPLRPCADAAPPSPAVPLQEQLPGPWGGGRRRRPLPGSPGAPGGAAQLPRAWPSGASPSKGLVLWPSSQARAPLATEPAGELSQHSNQSRWVEAPCSAPASPLARRLMQEVGPPPGLCAPGPRVAGLPGGCSCGGSQCGTPNGSTGGVTSSDEALPSIGSQGHPTKSCRPCHYFRTKAGCTNGYNCDYCHFKHSKRSRPRLPKLQRALCRALAQLAFDKQQGGGAGGALERPGALQALVDASASPRLASYTTSVLRSLQSGSVLQPSDLELILRREESPTSVPAPPKVATRTAEMVTKEVVQGLEGEVLEELCRLLQIDPDAEM